MKPIQIIAEIGKIETQTDGLKLVVYTNEASPEDLAELIRMKGKQGMMLFKPNLENFSDDDIKDLPEPKEFPQQKSLSERLRNVLWVYFTENGGKKENFEVFRAQQMEKFIQQVKDKLPEKWRDSFSKA